MDQFLDILREFSQKRVLVIGDVMLDRYLRGEANRVSPESPVLVLVKQGDEFRPGGAANTAMNLVALGAHVDLIGQVGDDEAGRKLRDAVRHDRLRCAFHVNEAAGTIIKTRVVANSQQVLRIDEEQILPPPPGQVIQIVEEAGIADFDLVIVSDYAKGLLSREVMDHLRSLGIPIVADFKPSNRDLFRGVFAICPNLLEAREMAGSGSVEELGVALVEDLSTNVVITRGPEGASIFEKTGGHTYLPVTATEVRDVSGAGDTFTAAFGLAVACGASVTDAAIIANHAAGRVVQKFGTAAIAYRELRASLTTSTAKTLGATDLGRVVDEARALGRKVVFTNGCFDMLHRGHVMFLRKARSLGDLLVVAVNTDASVRKLKGPDRPVMSEEDRTEVLAALDFVDHVVLFDQDDPSDLIARIEPDVFVKGRGYQADEPESLPEAQVVRAYGGEVQIIDGHITSTTEILERLTQRATDDEK